MNIMMRFGLRAYVLATMVVLLSGGPLGGLARAAGKSKQPCCGPQCVKKPCVHYQCITTYKVHVEPVAVWETVHNCCGKAHRRRRFVYKTTMVPVKKVVPVVYH